jgi:hypothetical protein
VLFIIKAFGGYSADGVSYVSNGLKSSATFVVDMLLQHGFKAALVTAIDGNCIDRLVTQARARIVILEAIWVTPAKMAELRALHPHVTFIVRVHSEVPFLSNEGISVQWLADYTKLGVCIAFNSARTVHDFKVITCHAPLWLPNYYPLRKLRGTQPHIGSDRTINVGCFGAIRPLKNQLLQAFAAAHYAQQSEKLLRFHMNGARQEQGGEQNLKSIAAVMHATGNELVLHPWMEHADFLQLITEMDICLQVSLSESFNIVSADAVGMGVPLIGSNAITWLPRRAKVDPTNMDAVVQAMWNADDSLVALNHDALHRYCEESAAVWEHVLEQSL